MGGLDPACGVETKKTRPCVVISGDLVNEESRSIVVAPLLRGHKPWPFVVNLSPSRANGLDRDRHMNLKQLRAIDVSRVRNRLGMVESSYRAEIDTALRLVFDTV